MRCVSVVGDGDEGTRFGFGIQRGTEPEGEIRGDDPRERDDVERLYLLVVERRGVFERQSGGFGRRVDGWNPPVVRPVGEGCLRRDSGVSGVIR